MNWDPSKSISLNPKQLEATQTIHGPLLISAGAGSGKTQILTSRIGNILSQGLAAPHECLAVTFTNKAAGEMMERIQAAVTDIPIVEPLWIGTFHAICARILRENIQHLRPLRKQVIIYDSQDQLNVIKQIMKDQGMDPNFHPPKNFKQQISLCKRQALSPEEASLHPHLRFAQDFPKFYQAYEQALIQASAFDFDGLLFEVHKLFNNRDEVLLHYQNKFKFISVDEYQDTNHIQYLLVKQLAKKHQNICVVGDEDQSIYSWRGADITNILNFEKDFPNCKMIKLEQNYRSTGNIVSAASSLISYNTTRKNKTLFTDNDEGDLIHVQNQYDEIGEARYIARVISSFCEQGDFSYDDFAVFYRTNAQSRILEDQLRSRGIDYQIVGSLKFYDRAEIKDLISYMRFILNPNDEISLRRIINTPKRGLGQTTLNKATQLSIELGQPLYTSLLQLAQSSAVSKKAGAAIIQFDNMIKNIKQSYNKILDLDFFTQILRESKYLEKLEMEKTPESRSRLENLEEFGNAIKQFQEEKKEEATLERFLEEMSLLSSETPPATSTVKLMTLHLSKGLEFSVVFITGLEEGLLPLLQNVDDVDVEEERRLIYVGMTRARKRLFLTHAQNRKRFGKDKRQLPSRFLKEIPSHYLSMKKSVYRPFSFG